MRLKTRLDNVATSESVKCPVLVSTDRCLSHPIVESDHRRLLHNDFGVTLAELREKLWVVSGRQCVKKVRGNMVFVQGFVLKLFQHQKPRFVATESRGFIHLNP